jgi:GDPmannose 4,6-dehydratase
MSDRRALVTGARGQDGSYLAELLEARDFSVVGLDKPERVAAVSGHGAIEYISVDLLDAAAVGELFASVAPTHVFHLASSSFVPASWDDPVDTSRFTVESNINLLEAARALGAGVRLLSAASAEIFGRPERSPQDEGTPIRPRTPYGAAKAHAFHLMQMYRERYGLHCGSAILYNHESPRRPLEFLPRKVASAAAAIRLGIDSELGLGNLDAVRDWSFAGDVVHAMFLMLEASDPDDYVIASGVGHTVRELVEAAFVHVDLDYRDFVVFDERFARPSDGGAALVGDSTLIRERLAWQPEVDFTQLVRMLVDADLERLAGEPGDTAREAVTG